jgi:hypothetical protein
VLPFSTALHVSASCRLHISSDSLRPVFRCKECGLETSSQTLTEFDETAPASLRRQLCRLKVMVSLRGARKVSYCNRRHLCQSCRSVFERILNSLFTRRICSAMDPRMPI